MGQCMICRYIFERGHTQRVRKVKSQQWREGTKAKTAHMNIRGSDSVCESECDGEGEQRRAKERVARRMPGMSLCIRTRHRELREGPLRCALVSTLATTLLLTPVSMPAL